MISTHQVKDTSATVQISLSFLQNLMGDYHPRNFAVRLWDGTQWEAEPGQPTRFTLVLKHPGALRKMFWPPDDLTLGEAYVYDDFDIEGDIEAVFSLANYLSEQRRNKIQLLKYARLLLKLPSGGHSHNGRRAAFLSGKRHSVKRDRLAVSYHYDVSNDFYKLWLDRRMVYSCAYFARPGDTLDTAQERKLDYICRKLRLRPGERLLDIGCGWGGLVIHAAKNYGVEAVGITLSQQQADLANEHIQQAGLSNRCHVEVRDYRQLDKLEGCDKLVSVGMFEHVGEALLPEYFARARRLLCPGSIFLNHGIARRATDPVQGGGPSFVQS
ncbi:MAG: cyclopropane-fatty-acyl-phospholipid synthase family protein [Candidatus Subteraquimicrobiales bacterium]|nr:cyclopropane-fatty-acyl-phospholipid synthase family protein [Candidatus Subteraquimicrobiales bacterium]